MVGLGEPRVVRAGVVGGSYFEVMGLRPVRGRLLDASDDGAQAAGAAVLTHRFWTTTLQSDPSVIEQTVRLGDRSATIVGVLEHRRSVPIRQFSVERHALIIGAATILVAAAILASLMPAARTSPSMSCRLCDPTRQTGSRLSRFSDRIVKLVCTQSALAL